jgi:hypothetical protein
LTDFPPLGSSYSFAQAILQKECLRTSIVSKLRELKHKYDIIQQSNAPIKITIIKSLTIKTPTIKSLIIKAITTTEGIGSKP